MRRIPGITRRHKRCNKQGEILELWEGRMEMRTNRFSSLKFWRGVAGLKEAGARTMEDRSESNRLHHRGIISGGKSG